jgi:predicted phosphatase
MNEEFLGKENHISSVITDIATRRKKTIKPQEVLLLDDDLQNILIAEEFGHRVLEIRDEINLDILKDFVCDIPSDS